MSNISKQQNLGRGRGRGRGSSLTSVRLANTNKRHEPDSGQFDDLDKSGESSEDDVQFDDDVFDGRLQSSDFPGTSNSNSTLDVKVLTTEDIVQHLNNSVHDANLILQLPPTVVRILLSQFKWNKEKLLDAYYTTDQDEFFLKAGVINPYANFRSSSSAVSVGGTEECQICYLKLPHSLMCGMECGHRFCVSCWNDYFYIKITEEGKGDAIPCAGLNCKILVDDATVMKLLTDPQVKSKYQRNITNSFVECNQRMCWCPAPDCPNAVRVDAEYYSDPARLQVKCSCGFRFCFQCGQSWHDLVECSWLKNWLRKLADDAGTSHWIAANTKDCPRCGTAIEKNGGCNFMLCSKPSCGTSFCWVCLGIWRSEMERHSCNRFNELAEQNAKEKTLKGLGRYLFYVDRYNNHKLSLQFENTLYASASDQIEFLQQHNISYIEALFLNKAVDVLCQCREILMYSYIFAYYVLKNNQSLIFEDNQHDLESAAEKLSGLLERNINPENISDMKQKVINTYQYCESRRKVLLDHVSEGYKEGWWTCNDC